MSPRPAPPEPAISPTPRPLRQPDPPEDSIAVFNERMREAVKPFYRALVAAGEEGVPLRPELLDQVGWLRAHGMRVQAKMRPTGTVYVLPTPPPGSNDEDAKRAQLAVEGSEAVAPREEQVASGE